MAWSRRAAASALASRRSSRRSIFLLIVTSFGRIFNLSLRIRIRYLRISNAIPNQTCGCSRLRMSECTPHSVGCRLFGVQSTHASQREAVARERGKAVVSVVFFSCAGSGGGYHWVILVNRCLHLCTRYFGQYLRKRTRCEVRGSVAGQRRTANRT
jgi:hypothetical protein